MIVDLKVTSKTKFNKGDLLICNENGTFEPISKEELLKDLQKEVFQTKEEIKVMKQFLKVYQNQMTKLMEGVLDNG